MNITTQYYLTILRTSFYFQEQSLDTQEKLVQSFEAFREATGATWKVDRETLLILSSESFETRSSLSKVIRECAAKDCGAVARSGSDAVPDEIWDLTLTPAQVWG